MTKLSVGDRVVGLRSDFGRRGVVVAVRDSRRDIQSVTVRYDESGNERTAPLSRWQRV